MRGSAGLVAVLGPDKEERRCRCSLDGRMVCMYLGRYVGM